LQTALGILVTITILPVGQLLLIPLENRFPHPSSLPDQVAGIIVLGGAIDTDVSAAHGLVTTANSNADPLIEALPLARRYPTAKILFTGGSADIVGPMIRESIYARRFFLEQGVASDRLIFEETSRNTWENASNSLAIVKPRPEEKWLLVTSAFHM